MAPSASTRAPRSLADDLRGRSSGQIRRLLGLRPDLLQPWPADLSELARRAADDASVLEAMQSLSTPELRVLEVYACLHEAPASVVADALAEPEAAVAPVVDQLWDRGLLWGGAPLFRIVRAAQQAFGPHPCGLGPLAPSDPDPDEVRASALDVEAEDLHRLVWESPVTASPTALSVPRGEEFVVPRQSALILREGRFLPPAASPPPVEHVDPPPAIGLWAPLAGVRHLLTELHRTPMAWHSTRGVSRRVLTDWAAGMSLPHDELVAWLELAVAAGLAGPAGDELRPTPAASTWLRQDPTQMWLTLVGAWLDSDRLLLRCRPDELGAGTTAGQPRTASHRRHILRHWPVGRADVRAHLAWSLPRMVAAREQIDDIAAELAVLGLLVGDLPSAALDSLPDDPGQAVTAVPPAQEAGLIVQPDLTVIAPLNVDTTTWRLLSDLSRLESWGPVTTHRLDPGLIRSAVGTCEPDELLARLAAASRTPLPQSLEYLVRDAARHQPVRLWQATLARAVGDEAEALRDLGLQEVGPATFSSPEPMDVVRRRLEDAGVAIEADEQTPRAVPLEYPHASAHDPQAVDRLVSHLVAEDRVQADPPPLRPVDPATVAARCQQAIAAGERLWLECREAGSTLTQLVEPFELRSGRVSGWSLRDGRTVTITLARVSAIGEVQ